MFDPSTPAPRLVVCALIQRSGRWLVGRRPPGSASAGMWEFPGGKVDPGEDPRAALARECREELDIEVRVGAAREILSHKYDHGFVILLFFDCEIMRGEPKPLDHDKLAWVTPDEMDALPLLPADRPMIQSLARASSAP